MEEKIIELQEKNQLTHNIFQFIFNKPENFEFEAGQFVQFMIPDGNSYSPRSYSIASTPDDDYLEFCIKILKEGLASNYLPTLSIGDKLNMKGPFGSFTVSKKTSSHTFLATSCGIAPIISMITDLLNKDQNTQIKLLFGLRSEEDIFYKDRLDKLSQHNNFSYNISLSQPSQRWNGLEGRITDHLNKLDQDSEFYVCGNRDMIQDVMNSVDAKTEIHTEIF
ncbi:MAG: ferredoxin--NADP reductase [Candidatus Magasanikbacteria bacterium]